MRFVARVGIDRGQFIEVKTFFIDKDGKLLVNSEPNNYISITNKYPAAIWFERKISEDFGISFKGSFDNRPLSHQEYFPKEIYPLRKNYNEKTIKREDFIPYDYETIDGEGIFQVSVGPIHAGIIEPGHFHFSQEGESILHLEVRHFYKYRAIEKMLEGKKPMEAFDIVEKISGNETIAYQMGYLDILSQSSNKKIPEDIKKYNALLLEIERILHHLTDIGYIPNDAGFSPALSFCSTKVEETRELLKTITSHRFGFGSIRGESKNIDKDKLLDFLNSLKDEIKWFKEWVLDIPSLSDRMDRTGILRTKNAIKYSTVGVVARASGLKTDVRVNDPFYVSHGFTLQREQNGDVASRFKLRINEIENSIEMIKNLSEFEPKSLELESFKDGFYTSRVESSIGELFFYVEIKDGLIDRFYVRDPSFINWQALHLMMDGNIIADFPLINKSCDLSYAGSDL